MSSAFLPVIENQLSKPSCDSFKNDEKKLQLHFLFPKP